MKPVRGVVAWVAGLAWYVLTATSSSAAPAGEVLKVVGRASAASTAGEIRLLQDGNAVEGGDIIVTGVNSWARMKLTDGSFVVLRPNTRFQIAEYNYEEDATKSRSIFNLFKGGFRAITGLIGQRNKAAVSYRTTVATIGIRGTDLEAIDCTDGCPDLGVDIAPGMYFTVHEGEIEVQGHVAGQPEAVAGCGGAQGFAAGSSGVASLECKVAGDTRFDWRTFGCPDCGR